MLFDTTIPQNSQKVNGNLTTGIKKRITGILLTFSGKNCKWKGIINYFFYIFSHSYYDIIFRIFQPFWERNALFGERNGFW